MYQKTTRDNLSAWRQTCYVQSVVIRLTRKLADVIDGIDISPYRVGQVLNLPFRAATLLIAEGWAELIERRRCPSRHIGLQPVS
jgi:hypothetical protein